MTSITALQRRRNNGNRALPYGTLLQGALPYGALALLSALTVSQPALAQGSLSAPRLSDVCLSSRWFHPRDANDPYDTFEALTSFHATRNDWLYSEDAALIQRLHQGGWKVFLALNPIMGADPTNPESAKGWMRDRKGEPMTAPWMRSWSNVCWGDVNQPQFQTYYLARAKRLLATGANGLHMDDPDINSSATRWGDLGSFSDENLRGFRDFLEQQLTSPERTALGITDLATYDVRAIPLAELPERVRTLFNKYQAESVRRFYREVWQEIDRDAGHHVPFSMNNFGGDWNSDFMLERTDFGLAEMKDGRRLPKRMWTSVQEAAKRGKAQAFTFVSEDLDRTRDAIALSYALGSHVLVPWDVYLQSTATGSQRYFGKPEEYADLFGFVRAIPQYLDGYKMSSFRGAGVPEETSPPVKVTDPEFYAAVRRSEVGQKNAPVIVHLVDFNDTPKPHVIELDATQFFDGQAVEIRLLQATAYDKATHQEAEAKATALRGPGQYRGPAEAAAYAKLVKSTPLTAKANQKTITVSCPTLSPWGILVITPAAKR